MPPTDADTQEFLAPDNGGWHYTIMRDWIAVCPDLSPTAVRLYWIVRSIMLEKGDRSRRLSIDQMCWLLPGINGKPTGKTRVEDALRELERVGLLSNPDGDVVRRWVTHPTTGKQTRENYRRWQIHDFPNDGYEGPRSAWDLLDEYPGHGWREQTPAASETAPDTETRKSGSQSQAPTETRKSGSSTRKSGSSTRKSGSSTRKSGSSTRKSGDFESVTCEKPPLKEVLEGSSRRNPPPPSPRGDEASADEAPSGQEGGGGEEPPSEEKPNYDPSVMDMLTGIPISSGKRRPSSRSAKVRRIAARVQEVLDRPADYGLRLHDLRRHLSVELDSVRSIPAVWEARLAEDQLPDPPATRADDWTFEAGALSVTEKHDAINAAGDGPWAAVSAAERSERPASEETQARASAEIRETLSRRKRGGAEAAGKDHGGSGRRAAGRRAAS